MAIIKSRSSQTSYAEQIINSVNRIANWVACFAIAAMVAFVFYDVIARASGHPVSGSNDVVQALSVVAVAFAMGYTQVLKRHPSVSFLTEKLSPRPQAVIAAVTSLLGIFIFALLAWQSMVFAERIHANNEQTMTLGIPLYPLIYCIAFGSMLMCLAIAMDFVGNINKLVQRWTKH